MNWRRPEYLPDASSTIVYLPQMSADGHIFSSDTISVPVLPSRIATYYLPSSSTSNQKKVLDSLVNLVKIAQQLILIGKPKMKISKKGPGDFVTDIDKGIELLFRDWIYLNFPKSKIIGEEGQKSEISEKDLVWYIDPIDGTRSFVDGYPGWVTQVALVEHGTILKAAIYAPDLDLLYLASKGEGSTLNGGRLMVKKSDKDQVRLIDNYPKPEGIAKIIMKMIPCKNYIESGGISLKICRVADGMADLFVKDVKIRDWDVVAPMLVLEEAGGSISTGDGSKFLLSNGFDKSGKTSLINVFIFISLKPVLLDDMI